MCKGYETLLFPAHPTLQVQLLAPEILLWAAASKEPPVLPRQLTEASPVSGPC